MHPPGESARIELSLVSVDGGSKRERRYRVLDDGDSRSVVEFLDPLEHGQKILATSQELWFVSPRIHRAIRVPPAQRLFGEASYGDVARMRWSRDYTAELDVPPEERIGQEDCWRLLLSARSRTATYHRVRLWVTRSGWLPLRADYHVASGKLLKTAEFPAARRVGGRLENRVWLLRTAGAEHRYTVLTIESAAPAKFPEGQFSRRYLELHP